MTMSKGAALDELEKRFGGPMRTDPSVVTVPVTHVRVAARDNERVSLTIVNTGGVAVYLHTGEDVSATRGLRLGPTGGTVALSTQEDGSLPTEEWWAIADVGGSAVYVLANRRETVYKGGQ